MSLPDPLLEQRAEQVLLQRLDHHMGNALFLGAALPNVAMDLAGRGLFITVLDTDRSRLDRLLTMARERGLEQSFSVDMRPYASIEFLSSSFNVILAWEGIPSDMPPPLFFKKSRRELKAGNSVYLRVTPLPPLTEFPLPPSIKRMAAASGPGRQFIKTLDGLAQGLARRWSGAAALSIPLLNEAAGGYLQPGDVLPISILSHKLSSVPMAGPVLSRWSQKTLGDASSTGGSLEDRLARHPNAVPWASSVFLIYSKTLEFGRVFRV
jgi:hypothetical protein